MPSARDSAPTPAGMCLGPREQKHEGGTMWVWLLQHHGRDGALDSAGSPGPSPHSPFGQGEPWGRADSVGWGYTTKYL